MRIQLRFKEFPAETFRLEVKPEYDEKTKLWRSCLSPRQRRRVQAFLTQPGTSSLCWPVYVLVSERKVGKLEAAAYDADGNPYIAWSEICYCR